jgi:hypothetical protein
MVCSWIYWACDWWRLQVSGHLEFKMNGNNNEVVHMLHGDGTFGLIVSRRYHENISDPNLTLYSAH